MFNSYSPKNAYGFRIYKKDSLGKFNTSKSPILDYVQAVGPGTVSESFKYRISYQPTFGGTSVIDFGQGNNEIKLEGEWHIYHIQLPPRVERTDWGSGYSGAAASALDNKVRNYVSKQQNRYAKFSDEARSGREEFFDFLFMLWFSRQTQNFNTETNMQDLVSALGDSDKTNRFNYRDYALVFIDYDNNRELEVILPQDGFSVQRSTQDTNTFKYSLKMIVLTDLSKIENKRVSSPLNLSFALAGIINNLENLISLPLVLSGALISAASVFSSTVSSLRGLNQRMKNVQKQFKAETKFAQSTFQGALDEAKKTFKMGSGKQWNPETISKAIDDSVRNEKKLVDELKQQFSETERQVESFLALVRAFTTGQSQPSLSTDETPAVESEAYSWAMDAQALITKAQAVVFYASSDTEFIPLEVKPGDSYDSIANSILGNASFANALAIYNKDIAGKAINRPAIKIPFGKLTGINTILPERPSLKDMEIAIHGTDIRLTEQRDIAISPNGDLGMIQGEETLLNNILDVIDVPQGSWAVHPELGNPIPFAEIPESSLEPSYVQRLINIIQSDPRVKQVSFQGVEQDGDKFYFVFSFKSILDRSYFIQL